MDLVMKSAIINGQAGAIVCGGMGREKKTNCRQEIKGSLLP
jgi:hypothetical protein